MPEAVGLSVAVGVKLREILRVLDTDGEILTVREVLPPSHETDSVRETLLVAVGDGDGPETESLLDGLNVSL